jgi:hypothetical protein
VLFEQSLLGYLSPEPARLNGNTFPAISLPSATGKKVRRPCVERGAFLLCPIVPLIDPDSMAQVVGIFVGISVFHVEAIL